MRKPLNQYFPDYLYLFSIAGAILILDQVTKWLVQTKLDFTDVWMPFPSLGHIFRIVYWKNTGAAFGIFQNGNLFFIGLAIVVILGVTNFYPLIPKSDRWLRAALALQTGGALGNLIDRLTEGYVTDFLSFLRFPVFNVADASISLGVVLILIPLIPHFLEEMESSRLLKSAEELNLHFRSGTADSESVSEPYSLGLIEGILQDTHYMQEFILTQDVQRIRQRAQNIRKGISRG